MVLEVGEQVSKALSQQIADRKRSPRVLAAAKRRRLILGLRETLVQARDGRLEGKALADWLRKLQQELVVRLDAIDAQASFNGTDFADDTATEGAESSLRPAEDVIRSSYFTSSESNCPSLDPSNESRGFTAEVQDTSYDDALPEEMMSGALQSDCRSQDHQEGSSPPRFLVPQSPLSLRLGYGGSGRYRLGPGGTSSTDLPSPSPASIFDADNSGGFSEPAGVDDYMQEPSSDASFSELFAT